MLQECVLDHFGILSLLEDKLVIQAVLRIPTQFLTDVVPILISLRRKLDFGSYRKKDFLIVGWSETL